MIVGVTSVLLVDGVKACLRLEDIVNLEFTVDLHGSGCFLASERLIVLPVFSVFAGVFADDVSPPSNSNLKFLVFTEIGVGIRGAIILIP